MGRLPRVASAEARHKNRERHHVRDTEEGARLAHEELRIRGHDVGPLWGNGAHRLLVNLQQEAPARPIESLGHAHQLSSAEWMERMRDAHKARRSHRSACILE